MYTRIKGLIIDFVYKDTYYWKNSEVTFKMLILQTSGNSVTLHLCCIFPFLYQFGFCLNSLPFIHDVKHVGTYKRWVDDMKILLFYNKINVDPSLLIILNLTAMKYIFDHIFRQKLLCKYVSVILNATLTHWEFFLYSSIMKRKI